MKMGYKKTSFKKYLNDYWNNDSGATAIEYGLLTALIAVAMIVGLQILGAGNEGSWNSVAADVAEAMDQ